MKEIYLKNLLNKNNINSIINLNLKLNIINNKKYIINNREHVKFFCENDCYFWTVNNQVHHELTEPAISLFDNTTKIYGKDGYITRESDKPSIIIYRESDNHKVLFWFKNGLIHRDNDKPAQVLNSKYMKEETWFNKGLMHREIDKPAFIDYQNNIKIWFKNGKMHRENGYAFINDSDKYYYINNVKLSKDKFIKYKKINNF